VPVRREAKVIWKIRRPWKQEWDRYRALLRQADLPVEGVGPDSGETFFVLVDDAGHVVGGIGLEGAGPDLLLRSLIVHPDHRDSGLGSTLLTAIEAEAAARNARAIYLLTTTATAFFAASGFIKLDREAAPERIRQSREFAALCPATAVLMVKAVAQPPHGSGNPRHQGG
jgi:amino-acid N-acetyltransferase